MNRHQCKQARIPLYWSQKSLAEAAGLSEDSVVEFERGIIPLKLDGVYQMMEAFESAGIQFIRGGLIFGKRNHVTETTTFWDLTTEEP